MKTFKATPPTRKKGGRPQMRKEYAEPIRQILALVPSTFVMQNQGNRRALQFLSKLADYLGSEEYAEKSAKNTERKRAWITRINRGMV